MSSLTIRVMSGSSRFIRRGAKIGVEEAPVLAVLRRIDLQRDERHRLSEVDRLHARRELLGMGEGVLDGTPPDDLGTERALAPPPRRPGPGGRTAGDRRRSSASMNPSARSSSSMSAPCARASPLATLRISFSAEDYRGHESAAPAQRPRSTAQLTERKSGLLFSAKAAIPSAISADTAAMACA